MMTITNLISSFAMGVTILLGQKIGEGDQKSTSAIIGTGVTVFFLVGVAFTGLVPILSGVLSRWMQAPSEAFAETKQYIAICGFGSVMIIAYNEIGRAHV